LIVSLARIDCSRIHDWSSFHDEFDRVFGFPAFYGRNMDAWIDCMTHLDAPEDQLTYIHCGPGKVLTIELADVKPFRSRCPELYAALIESAAFVNWRRIEQGESSVLALSFREQLAPSASPLPSRP
jgi:RNAse (barnase) inhibitor barstar